MGLLKAINFYFRLRKTSLLLLLSLLSLGALYANPSDLAVRSLITQKESLSKRPVLDILQDSLGYIWFASALDLSRYNGKTFQKYNNQSSSAFRLNSDRIQSIHLKGKGDILVQYEEMIDFMDYLPQGAERAIQISLGPDNGLDGERLSIFVDRLGQIYCLTSSGNALHIYQTNQYFEFEKRFSISGLAEAPLIDQFIRSKEGTFWLSQKNSTLQQYSESGHLLGEYRISKEQSGSAARQRQVNETILYEDASGKIWYASQSQPGLYRVNRQKETLSRFAGLSAQVFYTHLWEDLVGNIMVGSSPTYWEMDALYHIDEADKVLNYSDLLKEYDKVNVIYAREFSRVMFVGTYIGLKKIGFKNVGIQNYLDQELEEGEWGWSIRGMAQTPDGHIYIARELNEWYRFDPSSGSLQQIPFEVADSEDDQLLRNSFSLLYDEENNCLWGTRRNSGEDYFLLRYDLEEEKFTNYLSPNFIQCLGYSQQNIVWVGCGKSTSEGALYAYHIQTGQFQKFLDAAGNNPFEKTQVRYILEQENGLLWVGTKQGLYQINEERTEAKRYFGGDRPFSNHNMVCIVENEKGELLLGTEGGGLNIFNPQDETVRIYSMDDGLTNNYVSAIIPLGQDRYWLSTYEGLSYFDESAQSFRNFYVDDGLTYNEFNRFSFFKDKEDLVYFGGMNGFNVLDSEQLLHGRTASKIDLCLSKLVRYNPSENVSINQLKRFEKKESVRISPYDAYFQIDFFLPDYSNPAKIQYRYQLMGYENSWNDLGNSNYIRYHELPAGKYQLLIDAKPPGGQWGNYTKRLNIQVVEFFYKTKAAFFFYALALGLLFAAAYRLYIKRKLELAEATRLKELDEFKSRFYANISHEFRTPLTLISGPLDRVIERLSPSDQQDVLEDLKIAERNSQRLLYLINRILDLSKLEAGKLELNLISGDVKVHFSNLIHSFKPLLESRQLVLDFQVEMKDTRIDMDKQKLAHILTNLLANAIKFSPENGKITIQVSDLGKQWELKILDEGRGIPAEKLEAIFERFHTTKAQNALGTGIGLAFTKELVTLLGGSIIAENRAGKGAQFTVQLPLERTLDKVTGNGAEVDVETEIPISAIVGAGAFVSGGKDQRIINDPPPADLPLVLIVEDQYDVAQFIARCLASEYQTIKAENGVTGIETALEKIPDIIISDVMMPEKDGFELCAALKNDVRTSHIPIVLLTAKAAFESRLTGLEKGADDYLSKPFHERELKLRIRNLLKNRDQLRRYYSDISAEVNKPLSDPQVEVERVFVEKAKEVVAEHLLDHKFDIPTFCKAMNMSRTQLHRKLTAITGHSASSFINLIRLEKAKKLLINSDQSISEVAYATGFSDPAYFSRTFSKFYDCNPSEFRKKYRN